MRPLLMVHGISSNARRTFGVSEGRPRFAAKYIDSDSMYFFLKEKGYTPGKDLFWYSYPTFRPLPELAGRLKSEIVKVQEASGKPEVDLLTFSLGGIISKYYTISPLYQKEIRRIIMIAPPFLGSPKANHFKKQFIGSETDLIFPGDSKVRAPWILSENNILLKKLAAIPFPSDIETTIIAMKVEFNNKSGLEAFYYRLLSRWVGEGDLTVPVKSTIVPVNDQIHLVEEHSSRAKHKFLPYHPKIKALVAQKLGLESAGF